MILILFIMRIEAPHQSYADGLKSRPLMAVLQCELPRGTRRELGSGSRFLFSLLGSTKLNSMSSHREENGVTQFKGALL